MSGTVCDCARNACDPRTEIVTRSVLSPAVISVASKRSIVTVGAESGMAVAAIPFTVRFAISICVEESMEISRYVVGETPA
jgi:hypothetical protein